MQSSNNNVNPISNKMTKDITQNNNNEDKSDKLSLDKIKKIEDIKISLDKPSFWDMLKLWLGFSSCSHASTWPPIRINTWPLKQ
jgi:hypothetical protein